MHLMLRLPLFAGVLLSAGTSFAFAESPLPDPIAPAVIGRPLDQIAPSKPARKKDDAAKRQASSATAKPQASSVAKSQGSAAGKPLVLGLAPQAAATQAPSSQRVAKQAVDDRADPRMAMADDVGKGTHFARKRLGPGAYFAERHRTAVRKYYAENPASGSGWKWQIGEPVPRGASPQPVPKGLLARLPELPPGHQYIQLGGEVVLIAAESKMVVDGISRAAR